MEGSAADSAIQGGEKLMPDIREMPLDEIRIIKAYQSLMPDPSDKEFELLYENIRAYGLDPACPLVVNDDLVILDGHNRYEIAKQLKLEWVYVTVKETADRWDEREFVIMANLARRQLNTAQRAALGLKLIEIEKGRAKERQRESGRAHRVNLKFQELMHCFEDERAMILPQPAAEIKEALLESNESLRLRSNLTQADEELQSVSNENQPPEPNIDNNDKNDSGKAIQKVAQKVGVSYGTMLSVRKIQQVAQEHEDIAQEWEEAKAGKSSVHKVFRKARTKVPEKHYGTEIQVPWLKKEELKPPPPLQQNLMTIDEMLDLLWMVADCRNVCKYTLGEVMLRDPGAFIYWKRILNGWIDAKIGWKFIMEKVWRMEEAEMARKDEEKPLPEGLTALGPWELDSVHCVSIRELLEKVPEDSVHIVLTDARKATDEEIVMLGQLAQRVLVPGKMLCAYVESVQLPVAIESFSGAGLKYHDFGEILRPKPGEAVKYDDHWAMLMYRKPSPTGYEKTYFPYKSDHGEMWPQWRQRMNLINDPLIQRKFYVNEMPLQMLSSFTLRGQLVLDPFACSGISGVMGKIAIERQRRFILFDQDAEKVQATKETIHMDMEWAKAHQESVRQALHRRAMKMGMEPEAAAITH